MSLDSLTDKTIHDLATLARAHARGDLPGESAGRLDAHLCEVVASFTPERIGGRVRKFSEERHESYRRFSDPALQGLGGELHSGGAFAEDDAGDSREDMLDELERLGFDVGLLGPDVPDEVLAEMVRTINGRQDQPADSYSEWTAEDDPQDDRAGRRPDDRLSGYSEDDVADHVGAANDLLDQAGREYPEEHPPVYLSPLERRLVDKVKSAGRYVAWHPWGGDGHRNFNNVFDLEKMIDLILAQGWNLVVVGGQSLKIDHEGHLPVDHIPASREGYPRIFNMVPYSNVRVCAALVGEAPRFMGTDSCFAVHAALNKVYSLVSTCNNYWDGGCPLIIREGPTWLIHFDIWQRGEARLEEVIPSFLPK